MLKGFLIILLAVKRAVIIRTWQFVEWYGSTADGADSVGIKIMLIRRAGTHGIEVAAVRRKARGTSC